MGALALCTATAFTGACGAGKDSHLTENSGGGPGSGGSTSGVGGLGGNFTSSGGSSTGNGCTGDLQSVVDADGNVVFTCPPDQGCYEGACIPACEAAANSKGSIGCELWTPDPPFLSNEQNGSSFDGTCYAVFVANTWGRPAQLSVNYNGQALNVTDFARIPSGVGPSTQYNPLPATGLPPDEVAVLFLSHKPGASHPLGGSLECPITPAVTLDAAVHNSGRGTAFEVLSDTPVTAYDILPYGGAPSFLPSASLLEPRTAWGDNYVVVPPHQPSTGQLWVLMVGSVNNTTVNIVSPTAMPAGGTAPAIPANTPTPVTVNAGEIVQWLGADPAGMVMQSDQPIGVFAGNTYLRVPTVTSPGGGGQDSAHQQLPPVSALGSEYVGGGVVTRLATLAPESVLYRIGGVVDGTTLTFDPPVAGAPTALAQGQVVEFETTQFFVVRSQDEAHPFLLTQYMGGANSTSRPGCGPTPPFTGISCGLGDEEWVVQMPPAQYLAEYVFFTDPTYATTNLVITRVKGPNGFSDVNVGCVGTVTGWQPVDAAGNYEVAHVDLVRGAVGVTPACETSRHEASSEGKFGVVVWGTDYYASYGYPAGGNVGSINAVIVPPVPK